MKEIVMLVFPWVLTICGWAVVGLICALVAVKTCAIRGKEKNGDSPADTNEVRPFGSNRTVNIICILLAGPAVWILILLASRLSRYAEDFDF